jgi:pyruvate kinase
VADVANAILDGTDGVMLSAESAIGQYPVQSAATLARVATATERNFPYAAFSQKFAERNWSSITEAISFSAVRLASDCQAKAILVAPHAETTASAVSRFRPEAHVVQLCYRWEYACRETLSWGVDPLVVSKSWVRSIPSLKKRLKEAYGAMRGSRVILIQSSGGFYGAGSDMVRIVQL